MYFTPRLKDLSRGIYQDGALAASHADGSVREIDFVFPENERQKIIASLIHLPHLVDSTLVHSVSREAGVTTLCPTVLCINYDRAWKLISAHTDSDRSNLRWKQIIINKYIDISHTRRQM